MTNCFMKKTYGRIFVPVGMTAALVHEAVRELDAYEFDYMPKDIVAVWNPGEPPPRLVYTHKFEIDIDKLTALCWSRGIHVWCVTGYHDPSSFQPLPKMQDQDDHGEATGG